MTTTNEVYNKLLLDACEEGNLEKVSELITLGANVNTDIGIGTPLFVSSKTKKKVCKSGRSPINLVTSETGKKCNYKCFLL
jgi:hypothetical protein